MDMSKMGQGHMIAAVGGVLLIVGVFVNWGAGTSAWDAFSIVDILMVLVGIAAIVFAVLPASGSTATLPADAALIVAALGIAVFGFAMGWELEASSGIGVWLAILGSLGIAYGAYSAGRTPARAPSAATGTPAPPPGAPVA